MFDDFYDDYTYYFPKGVIITGITTASISSVSSILILSVIARTKARFSTIYHRILTFLSIGDLLASVPQMLSTLPMPKDQPYDFELPSYGNHLTCQIQGLSFLFGYSLVFWFSILLNVYHLCILKYEMQEITFKKWIERPGYGIGALITIGPAVFMWGKFKPAPIEPFCSTRFDPEQRVKIAFIIGITFGSSLVCMGLILWSFYTKKKKIERAIQNDHSQAAPVSSSQPRCSNEEEAEANREKKEILKHCQENSRKITIQALMYIFSFIAVFLFGFIETWLFNRNYVSYTPSHSSRQALAILRMLFQPLQGFFNMLIFLHQKVLAIQMNDSRLHYFEAMHMAVFHPNVIDHDEGPKLSNLELLLGNKSSNIIIQFDMLQQNDDQNLQTDAMGANLRRDDEKFVNVQDLAVVSTGRVSFDQMGMSTNSQQLSAFTGICANDNHSFDDGNAHSVHKDDSNLCLEFDAENGGITENNLNSTNAINVLSSQALSKPEILSQDMVAKVESSAQISSTGDVCWSSNDDISNQDIDSYIRRNQDLSIEDSTRLSNNAELT